MVDALYPNSVIDSDGKDYNGKHQYVLHFDGDKMPPLEEFWSLTMYAKYGFLIDSSINRYHLENKTNLTYNEDGSLDLYIQHESPEELKSNWLSDPPIGEEFELTFRMYWPSEEVISVD